MTKKLTPWQKQANKTRRSALILVQHLLKNPKTFVEYNRQYHTVSTLKGIRYNGEHTLTLKWTTVREKQ